MDILKKLSPQQLAALSSEQLAVIIDKGCNFGGDMAKLRDLVQNMEKPIKCSDCATNAQTGRCAACGSVEIKGNAIAELNSILLKHHEVKFYVMCNKAKKYSDILTEEEIKAKYPLIDIFINMPTSKGTVHLDTEFMNQFNPITAKNLIKVSWYVIDIYEHLIKNGVNMNHVSANNTTCDISLPQ